MFDADNTVSIRTFCTEIQPGSLQIIHLYNAKAAALIAAERSEVMDDFDHAFVYLNASNRAWVKWRNKAGEIQLCGSGAYALAWMMLKDKQGFQVEINSDNHTLVATSEQNKLCLTLPNIHPVEIYFLDDERMFVDKMSGIYLLELTSSNKLEDTQWLNSMMNMNRLSELGIHGFCAFHWDKKTNTGMLRYFVPWHGRDEDYVTGSIHQYLTPLIYDLYGVDTQEWYQCSSSHGTLTSVYQAEYVQISGNCQLVSA